MGFFKESIFKIFASRLLRKLLRFSISFVLSFYATSIYAADILRNITPNSAPNSAPDSAPNSAPDTTKDFAPDFKGATPVKADLPSASRVGWLNVFLPGGGQLLLGNYAAAAMQAALEGSTFAVGYELSAKSPMTLDGVPEDIPSPHRSFLRLGNLNCQVINGKRQCTRASSSSVVAYQSPVDIQKALIADFLQEVGLKAHMVNVYDAYRATLRPETGSFVDRTPTGQLFAAPFKKDDVFSSWVIYPLLLSVAYHAYSFSTEQATVAAPLSGRSKTEYGLVYSTMYPVGSAAPEEMFYRGFLQNEAYRASQSRWAGVLFSTLAYTLSHSPDSYVGAATSGLYLGALTYHENGKLSKGIAFHFWSDVIGGIHAILSLQKNQQILTKPAQLSFSAEF